MKDTIIVAAILVALASIATKYDSQPPPEVSSPSVPQAAKGRDFTKDMYELYADTNEQYFLGQLPKDTVIVFVEPLIGADGKIIMGRTDCIQGHCRIELDSKQSPNYPVAGLTLLHEMCHIKTWPKGHIDDSYDWHGPRFQDCMVNLAVRGGFHDLW